MCPTHSYNRIWTKMYKQEVENATLNTERVEDLLG